MISFGDYNFSKIENVTEFEYIADDDSWACTFTTRISKKDTFDSEWETEEMVFRAIAKTQEEAALHSVLSATEYVEANMERFFKDK